MRLLKTATIFLSPVIQGGLVLLLFTSLFTGCQNAESKTSGPLPATESTPFAAPSASAAASAKQQTLTLPNEMSSESASTDKTVPTGEQGNTQKEKPETFLQKKGSGILLPENIVTDLRDPFTPPVAYLHEEKKNSPGLSSSAAAYPEQADTPPATGSTGSTAAIMKTAACSRRLRDDSSNRQQLHTAALNYARAEELAKVLTTLFPGSKLAADPVTNTVLCTGNALQTKQFKEALDLLDKAGQQVTLEAKILAINKSAEKDLGLNWNWDILPRYPTASSENKTVGGAKSADSANDYPGHLRLGKNTRAQFNFYATLHALLTSGKAKVLATPSIITIPGKEAGIFIGSHIPVVTEKYNNGQSSYATEYLDAGIKLTYTPIVSQDGLITATVHTEVSTPALVSELKNYRINSRTADTNVRMKNGETLVIGGLLSEEEQNRLQQIPLLSKIPLLGELFKHRYSVKTKTEVIMLLTPYLTEPGKAPVIYDQKLAEMLPPPPLRQPDPKLH